MLIVDTAIRRRLATGRPVAVGLYGVGFMGRGMVVQAERHLPVLRFAAICNRNVERAIQAFLACGIARDDIVEVHTHAAFADALARGKRVVTSEIALIAESPAIDIAVESTGHVEYGARVTLACIAGGKDIVSLNVELDATVGPLLKARADAHGVILSGADGDQPGVTMNLVRHIRTMGLRPLVCGNIKGLQDRTRNPATQAGFARQWNQTPAMVASFADGTKMTAEQAIVANAVGLQVSQRGMIGRDHDGHVDELVDMYDHAAVEALGGIVDYVVKARPSPGIYVLAGAQDDNQRFFLDLGKLGKGPFYSFYTAWHLTTLEFPISIARVALCRDVIIAPAAGPRVDVVATAKTDLRAGDAIDGIGGFKTYGIAENYATARRERLLPMGLAEGCRLRRDVARDQVLTYEDVDLAPDALVNGLRAEQDLMFPVAAAATAQPHLQGETA
ncbi:NAD(P)H-dependent oxidoreductase [Coralloluteibacterium stylophorae]|uniref:NAD(P)-dependent oxidoreductase n=1 Tax=Coralloluteibacterium stylophorae TaxID=1776034 RepID=A0AAP2FY88_9GAMM|nr:SAF domain-containing protein [Coralloluteibacterium stylophorae]MBS7455655.1 NAD(P)-dependent oxidoreductase [Coralloluteibacterium stylophorae]